MAEQVSSGTFPYQSGRKLLYHHLDINNVFILTGNGVTSSDVVVIGVVIFFLSLGAPNQPGSTLIGLLVIIGYLEAPEMISLAVFSEALFGGILSMTNAAGDIVTVMTAEQKAKKIARKNAAEDAAGSAAGGQAASSAAEEGEEAAQTGQVEAAEPENGIEGPQ